MTKSELIWLVVSSTSELGYDFFLQYWELDSMQNVNYYNLDPARLLEISWNLGRIFSDVNLICKNMAGRIKQCWGNLMDYSKHVIKHS